MQCEYCQKEHEGSYASGRFCSQECSRGYSTKAKRKEINKKVREKLIKRELHPGTCEYCGKDHDGSYGKGRFCNQSCRQSFSAKKSWEVEGRIGYFFDEEARKKSNEIRLEKLRQYYESLPFEDLPKKEIKKHLMIKQGDACLCGLKEWLGKPITLQLDHINGDNFDNREENVRLLCPNCHSQTETFCNHNAKKGQVSNEKLIEALKNSPNVRQALLKVGLTPKAGNYSRCYKLMVENQLEI